MATNTTAPTAPELTLTELVQLAMDAHDLANNAARYARGESFMSPQDADDIAAAWAEHARFAAEAEATDADVDAAVAFLVAEYAAMDRDELAELYDIAAESFGELRAEAGNEVALYGDSWAGSGAQLAAGDLDLRAMRKALALTAPAAPVVAEPEDDGEPF